MMVKVCGITNQADADAAAGAGALGFNFYRPSPRYVDPESAAAIVTPAGVLRVGVFVNEPRAVEIARQARLDVIQLHGDEQAAPAGFPVWKAFRVTSDFSMDRLTFPAEAFLLDAPGELYGGSGHTFDWTRAKGAADWTRAKGAADWSRAKGAERKILLAGGLGPDNVQQAIATARPWGVDACSRLELRPGIKDHAKVARFIELALTA
ncbi:MAG: phosphoribosylanthranilate isomerase [Acidobacteria bacterium]|jgi:phosphoribosylanthranilate isomerase|nr:phosphoribosylanthranilate isomerase [Bryobacteraceae bacterium CoA2 C42]